MCVGCTGLVEALIATACFGHAVAVFGQYKSEKSDGSEVEVSELLDFARNLPSMPL